MYKEEKICSFTAPKRRIQLLKITKLNEEQLKINSIYYDKIYFQVRINRKIIENTISESIARKKFASITTSEILQQKFSF